MRHLDPAIDADYPLSLRSLDEPPPVSIEGSLGVARRVAIVGTRKPVPEALAYAHSLASRLAALGVEIVSGGAVGIDAAAHRGALSVKGRTVVVLPCGHPHVFPERHDALYGEARANGGTLVWPFAPGYPIRRHGFVSRNRVLAALSDALIVVQARLPSGALSAWNAARKLGRPTWAVVASPWVAGFEGCNYAVAEGARPLVDPRTLFATLGLASERLARVAPANVSARGRRLLDALGPRPIHRDELAKRARLGAAEVATELTLLLLRGHALESPPGFFSKRLTG